MIEYYDPGCIEANVELQPELKYDDIDLSNHRVVGIFDYGLYKMAPDVTEKPIYGHFYRQYLEQHFLSMTLYAVTPKIRSECLDRGWNAFVGVNIDHSNLGCNSL